MMIQLRIKLEYITLKGEPWENLLKQPYQQKN